MIDNLVRHHRILGIDPGTTVMGYALIEVQNNKVQILDFGVLDLHKIEQHYERLQRIFFFTLDLVDRYKPTELAIESQFFGKNVQSMLKLGRGQGVAIAAALYRDLPINEYAPLKIKMAITGNGQASKEQVAGMLQRFLHIPAEEMPRKLDATDALAVAYCHYLQLGKPITDKPYSSWKDFLTKNPNKIH